MASSLAPQFDVFDEDHILWTVYPYRSSISFAKGDRVFVNLHNGVLSGAMDGEGVVVSDSRIVEEDSKWKGRYKVVFDSDGTSAHVNANRMYPRFPVVGLEGVPSRLPSSAEGTNLTSKVSDEAEADLSSSPSAAVHQQKSQPATCTVVMVAETQHYREVATTSVRPDDVAIDIGSSAGMATKRLHVKTHRTIGFDLSDEIIAKSRADFPEICFEKLNILEEKERFLELAKGTTVVFADIGGDRDFESMAKVVKIVMEHIKPRLFVIKNRAMVRHAAVYMGRSLARDKWCDKTKWEGNMTIFDRTQNAWVDVDSTGRWWAEGLVSKPDEWKKTWWPCEDTCNTRVQSDEKRNEPSSY